MTLKRMMVGALTSAALVSAAFAAPAPASDTSLDASGSQTVPLGTVGGCYRYITVWWNISYYPYAGTSGRISC